MWYLVVLVGCATALSFEAWLWLGLFGAFAIFFTPAMMRTWSWYSFWANRQSRHELHKEFRNRVAHGRCCRQF
jgi:hypothetical protein